MTLADDIRAYAYRVYIEPARGRGEDTVTIRAGDVHSEMDLSQRLPAVCSALGTQKFQRAHRIRLTERRGPANGANFFLTFEIGPPRGGADADVAGRFHRASVPPGDSLEQQQAGDWLRQQTSRQWSIQLVGMRLNLERGSYLELGGYCESPPVFCEFSARIGKPKAAQKHKAMTDAMKLLFARQRLGGEGRCILVFADEQAADFFRGTSWMAECLEKMDVEVEVVELSPELREQVQAAQNRQYR